MKKNRLHNRFASRFIIAIIIALSSSCSDTWNEREYSIMKDVYLFRSANDGPRLFQKLSNSNYKDLINSTVCQLFKKDSFLFVKADPQTPESDTMFYLIVYADFPIVNAMAKSKFDSLSNNLPDLVQDAVR